MEIFSDRLRTERKLKKYSQRELAQILGIPQSTYMHYELLGTPNGREPSMEMMLKIALALDVSIDYLLGKEDI